MLLDGDKLSDHYHIEPISYAGAIAKNLRLKTLTKYDDGECYAYFLNYGGSTRIPPYTYNQIEQTILDLPDETKEQKKKSENIEYNDSILNNSVNLSNSYKPSKFLMASI